MNPSTKKPSPKKPSPKKPSPKKPSPKKPSPKKPSPKKPSHSLNQSNLYRLVDVLVSEMPYEGLYELGLTSKELYENPATIEAANKMFRSEMKRKCEHLPCDGPDHPIRRFIEDIYDTIPALAAVPDRWVVLLYLLHMNSYTNQLHIFGKNDNLLSNQTWRKNVEAALDLYTNMGILDVRNMGIKNSKGVLNKQYKIKCIRQLRDLAIPRLRVRDISEFKKRLEIRRLQNRSLYKIEIIQRKEKGLINLNLNNLVYS